MRLLRWLRDLPPFAILAIGWAVFFVHAYPGRMTRDSFDQLRQARSGVFLDDHPPLMQAIVWVTDLFIAGPIGVVILQSLLLLAGSYLLLRRAMRDRAAALLAVAVLVFPPVVTVMVVMWKDPMMAGALIFATALLLSADKRVRVGGLLVMLVGGGVRLNGLAATFALVVLLFEWIEPQGTIWMKRLKRYGLAFGVWVAVTAASFGVNALLTDRETHYATTMLVDDIVGTLHFVDGDLPDAELRETLAGLRLRLDRDIHAGLRRAYRSDTMLYLVAGDARVFDLPLADVEPPSVETRARLVEAWKAIVLANPGAYLQYRVDRFRVVLGLMHEGETTWDEHLIVTHDYQDKALIWTYGVSTTTSSAQRSVDEALEYLSHTWLFRPYIYLVLTLLMLRFARRDQLAMALLLSGLGMELSLFFLAHSPDYRYSHWTICTTVLAAILLFAARLRGNPRPS
jgi:hypothetical protein